jgi:hypothetical protein
MWKQTRFVCLCLIPSLLPACGTAPIKPVSAPVVEAAPQTAGPAHTARQRTVDGLLNEAEAAMRQGRFALPAHDNAYDRFRAVEMLDPGNRQAQSGMQGVLLVYVDRVQQALGAGRLHAAAADLRQARQLFPGAPLLVPLQAELDRRSASVAQTMKAPVPEEGRERIQLPPQPLAQKSPDVKQMLEQLAQRVSQSDESVMIYARNDAEGRWIYKTMKDAVGDYRIRGDIRISAQPALEFLSPME